MESEKLADSRTKLVTLVRNSGQTPADGADGFASRIRILVADEHPVVREGLVGILNRHSEMELVAQAQDGAELVSCFAEFLPDVAIFDLQLPAMDGIQATSSILEKQPTVKVVIFTACQGEEHIYRALQAGAKGYLPKTSLPDEIISCIHTVFHGRTWIPPAIGATLARRLAAPELTRREREVLQAMSAGKSNKQIGMMLNMSEGTVKVHVTHILEKLKVAGRTEALGAALSRGLISLERPTVSKIKAVVVQTTHGSDGVEQNKVAM